MLNRPLNARTQKGSDMNHITVHRKGEATPGPLRRQDSGLFLCPFCSATHYKPTEYPQIMAHLASHKWKAIQHEDYVIYSCKLGCDGKSVHFHCCRCSRSYRNRSELLKHLKSHPTPEGQPPPPEGLPPPTEPAPPTGPHVQPVGPPTPLPHLKSEPPMEDQSRAEPPPTQPQPPTEQSTITLQAPTATAEPPTPPQPRVEPPIPPQPRVEPPIPPQPRVEPPHLPPVSHITVHRKGEATPGPLRRQDSGLFLCPFCSATHYKPTEYPQIMAHLASHKWKAIQHEDYVIYSCKLGCDSKSVHFHCCRCSRSYRNRSELLKHLKSHPTPEGQPPPPEGLPPPTEPAPPTGPHVHPAKPPIEDQSRAEPPPTQPQPPVPTQPPADPSNRPPVSHITVHRKGEATPGPLRRQDSGLFLCPFCSATHYKPTEYPQIMAHLASHKWKAIQHEDYVIYSCKLGCDGKSVHFHCCRCSRSYRNRSDLLKHLKSHPTPEGQPPPPTEPPPPERLLPHPPEPLTPPQPHPPPTRPHPPPPRPRRKARPPKPRPSVKTKRKSVRCSRCGLWVNSGNLWKHTQRKHGARPPRYAITARRHPPSRRADEDAYAESFMGPRVPVYVAKDTRGARPRAGREGVRSVGRVTLGGPEYKRYAYEPEPGRYGGTGGVLVDYDSEGRRGAAARLHESVTKWCLFQTTERLFTGPSASEPDGETPSREEEEEEEDCGQRPGYLVETQEVGLMQYCLS